jgi:predicted XRE-type DNA-binding protein
MKAVRWEDTKRRIREIHPDWDSPERVEARERSREELRAEQRGYQLAQLRKNAGLTQAQIASAMGVSQARVSQIEHGKITEMDAVRSYVEALGGTVDVIARVGDWTIKVA